MSQFPWNNSTSTIASELAGQFETPAGSQTKADSAEKNAKDYSDSALTAHTSPTNLSAHSAKSIVQDETHRFVTDVDKLNWNAKAPSAIATTTTSGLMSSSDKSKLDTIANNAQVNQNAFSAINGAMATMPNDTLMISGGVGISVSGSGKNLTITASGTATPGPHASTHVTGGADVIPDAIANGASGLFSGSDKNKLDGIQNGANNYVHPATHPPSIIAQDSTNRFVTDTQVTSWDAKETPSGAQTKANTAETNAKNSSLSKQGGTITGALQISGNGGMFGLVGVDHSYTEFFPKGLAAGRKAFVGFADGASTEFTINSSLGAIAFSDTNGTVRLASLLNFYVGSVQPNGNVSAPVGSLYRNLSGGSMTTFYVKESGASGNSGWVGK